MASYSIRFKESVRKDLRGIPKKDVRKILSIIAALAENPRPLGCKKLSGEERYRLRQGNYRILYSIEDRILTVCIVKVGHRREVYR